MDKKFDVAAVADVSNNTYIDRLKRTKKQEVLAVIDALKYEHRYGVSAMMGPFNEREAEHHYKRLLNALAEFPGLTPEEITELKEEIEKLLYTPGALFGSWLFQKRLNKKRLRKIF